MHREALVKSIINAGNVFTSMESADAKNDMYFLFSFRLVSQLLFMCLLAVSYMALFRQTILRCLSHLIKIIVLICLVIAYLSIMVAAAMLNKPSVGKTNYAVIYRHNIGILIYLCGIVSLLLYYWRTSIEGNYRLGNLIDRNKVDRSIRNWICLMALVVVISRVLCASGIYYYVMEEHFELIKLSEAIFSNLRKKFALSKGAGL